MFFKTPKKNFKFFRFRRVSSVKPGQILNFKLSKGFTLLEIIVVFSVISIVATVGVAAFVNYSKTQSLQVSYLDLKNTLATAKSYSISQVKPAECVTYTLIGYEVNLDIFNNKYSLIAKCQGFDKILKTSSFPANITFNNSLTTSNSLLFPILSKQVTGGSITIQLGKNPVCPQDCRTITIDDLGGIR